MAVAPGRLALAAASLGLTLLALEAALRLLPPQPDGFGHTRAARRWAALHWQPINPQGFRDVEHDAAVLRSTRRLVVLGDSFAAGDGVEDVDDRFAGVLARELGAGWSVVVLARRGWSTADQAAALERLAYPPHELVLAHYLNDIEGAAARHGRTWSLDLAVEPAWLAALVERSELANLVYWRLRRARIWSEGRSYAEFVYAAFADEAIWRSHAGELQRILDHARRVGARPLVVLFPHLFDLEGSAPATTRLKGYFRERGVTVLDVGGLVASGSWTQAELFAAPVNPHPSPALHREVARALLPLVANPAKEGP